MFLINPNGIIFNSNASLNIGGSFITTTANSLNFSDGINFSAINSQTPPLLTINVPIGLQFGTNPANIQVQDSSLEVNPGQTLALVGGNMQLNGGQLLASGGNVELGGMAVGTVGLNVNSSSLLLSFPDGVQGADVSLNNGAEVNVRAGGGGSITIHAQNLSMDGSKLQAGIADNLRSPNPKAGDIDINASGSINLNNSRISNSILPGAVGKGGDINITAGSVSLVNYSGLSTFTLGQGEAGNLNLNARDTVSFDSSFSFTGLQIGSIGKGGDINITSGSLFISNPGGLTVSTGGQGDGGSININVRDTVSLDGLSSINSTVEPEAVGNSGDITINTKIFRVTDGAVLSARSKGDGQGGNISITAQSFEALRGGQLVTTTFAKGQAGNIFVNATDLVKISGSDLNYANRQAEYPSIDINETGANSGLFANTQINSTGQGGGIEIITGQIIVQDDSQIAMSSVGSGSAGNLKVIAYSIELDNQASLSADTTGGQGNINLRSRDFLLLRRGSSITTNATGNATGGNITIDTYNLVAVPKENSDISANAENSFGGQVIVNASGIFGTQFRLQPTPLSDITASSARGSEFNGVVQLNTPDVNPSQGLTALPTNIIDTSQLIANSCIARTKRPEGKFIITGNGGLPVMPDDPSIAPYQTFQIPTVQSASISTLQENTLSLQDSITGSKPHNLPKSAPLIEAQGWMYGPHGEVILTASAPTAPAHSFWSQLPSCSGS